MIQSQKREHSRKPDELYEVIERCSAGPYLELFARGRREGWVGFGNEANERYAPSWPTYANHSQAATDATASGVGRGQLAASRNAEDQ